VSSAAEQSRQEGQTELGDDGRAVLLAYLGRGEEQVGVVLEEHSRHCVVVRGGDQRSNRPRDRRRVQFLG
jgi:hypothetical protein